MSEESIEIEGLSELSTLLTEIAPKAAKRYLRKCVAASTKVILDAMHETVPVGVGILEESLVSQTKWGETDDGNGDPETSVTTKIGVKKGIKWGSIQEYGSVTQEGQHWMGNAWESCQQEALDVFVEKAKDLIQDLKDAKTGE